MAKKAGHVLRVSREVVKWLRPFSKRIEIVGSIRRKIPKPIDVDIVLIPKSKKKILECLKTKGKFLRGGDKQVSFRIRGVKVELYYTTPESWGATLLAYSGRRGSNIGLRIIARTKGFKLNQYGLFRKGKCIAGKTEREIYKALGRKYKEPWGR